MKPSMYSKLDARDVTEPRTPMVGNGVRQSRPQIPMFATDKPFDTTTSSPMVGGDGLALES